MVEVIAGNNGLGYLLEESRANLDMPTMFATLLTLGVLGYYIDVQDAEERYRYEQVGGWSLCQILNRPLLISG